MTAEISRKYRLFRPSGRIALALLLMAFTMVLCSDRATRKGLFNNRPELHLAYSDHASAWRSEGLTQALTTRQILELNERFGGHCLIEDRSRQKVNVSRDLGGLMHMKELISCYYIVTAGGHWIFSTLMHGAYC